MAFNACEHQITQIVIKAGRIIRELKGLPEEKNITIVYDETAPLLGLAPKKQKSSDADNIPELKDMKSADGMLMIPLKKCNKCGKDSMEIFDLCPNCEDAKGENGEPGKYKTKFLCKECKHEEKSEKHIVIWLQEMGVDFANQPKKDLGIKTITDDGIK